MWGIKLYFFCNKYLIIQDRVSFFTKLYISWNIYYVWPCYFVLNWAMKGVNFVWPLCNLDVTSMWPLFCSLFPTMPRHNLYKIQPMAMSLCKKYGINHQIKPLGTAFMDIVRSVMSGKRIISIIHISLPVHITLGLPGIQIIIANSNSSYREFSLKYQHDWCKMRSCNVPYKNVLQCTIQECPPMYRTRMSSIKSLISFGSWILI